MITETISAVVALGSLVIAAFSWQDSRKSAKEAKRANDLVSQQLQLATAARVREEEKDVRESRPFLRWRCWGTVSATEIWYEFINDGAPIWNIRIQASDDLVGQISPSDLIGAGAKGKVKFQSTGK